MKNVLCLIICLCVGEMCVAKIKVQRLLTENLVNPLCIDSSVPRFSWQLAEPGRRDVLQTSYELKVTAEKITGKGQQLIWTSGKVISDQSLYVPYKGVPLNSGQRYYWQVRVWNNYGEVSSWSDIAWWQMGLLNVGDWKAKWIGAGFKEDSLFKPSPLFRKAFYLRKKIRSAIVYVTSHGLYEANLNGQRIGDAYLTPGWTSYQKRLQYQAYNVTSLLQPGNNAIGATLGSGWYRGHIGFDPSPQFYSKALALLLQLHIIYDDGSTENVISDESWKSSTGEIRSSEIYDGETIDDRKLQTQWARPTFNDDNWSGVKIYNFPKDILLATYNEPVREHESFKPMRIFKTPKGAQIIDFGQNLVGWVKLKVSGKAGDTIKIWHAEVLDKSGEFYTDNLRTARSENIYILNGNGVETFKPHFSWQGFRYIKIENYPGNIKPEDFTAIALYSDMRKAGTFTCSNSLINQLQHNIQWGQRGNFLDVPTDCPQRDERLGWTGDAQVFSRTASFNFDVHNFFTKWLKDVATDQYSNGSVPHVIPDVFKHPGSESGGSAGWSDVSTIVPWNMYVAYGDKRILENQYESMKGWVEYMRRQSRGDLWNTGVHFGDWLYYSINDDNDGSSAITNKYLIAQCFYAYSTQLLINSAEVLGKKEDVKFYTTLLSRIKDAYLREYVTPNGLISSDTQTAYVLALEFDVLPERLRHQAAGRLADNVIRYGTHLTTGFLGTPYLCFVLSRFGYTDLAFKLLLQDTYPSWLYPVKMGATTIWERWDGIRPDGTFETPSMNSFNHYAYGAIGDWLYRVIAGIDTKDTGPGYKQIVIKPTLGGNLNYASADYETGYGLVSSHWKLQGGKFEIDLSIPANTTATIYLPAKSGGLITEDNKPINTPLYKNPVDGYVPIAIGSGNYHFVSAGFY